MLIEFKVGKFLSFDKVQTLRMAQVLESNKGTSFDEPSDMMFIYGSNGAGKSNLIKAMKYARDTALHGISSPIGYNVEKNPRSYFEFVIEVDDTVYSYGFEIKVKTRKLHSEWLFILDEEQDIPIFEDEYDKESTDSRRNQLHLSMMNEDDPNYMHAIKIKKWLENSLFIESSRICDEIIPVHDDFIETLSKGLNRMDTGIVKAVEEPFRNTDIPLNLIKHIDGKEMTDKDGDYLTIISGGRTKRSWLIHTKTINNHTSHYEIKFAHEIGHVSRIEDESLGTMRLIQILALFSMSTNNSSKGMDSVIVADELECSIHTLAVRTLIDIFNEIQGDGKQLIATTHRADILRNSEVDNTSISFVDYDKTSGNGSRLYTLTSFDNILKDRHKCYLDGRMSAIPIFTNPHLEE